MREALARQSFMRGKVASQARRREPVQDGRLFGDKGTPAKYSAGFAYAIERGWLTMHEAGPMCG